MIVTVTLPSDVEDVIRETALRNRQTTEETIAQALQTLFAPEVPDEAHQRRRGVLADILTRAQTLESEPPDSPARTVAREDPVTQTVVEKFRRQGFHL